MAKSLSIWQLFPSTKYSSFHHVRISRRALGRSSGGKASYENTLLICYSSRFFSKNMYNSVIVDMTQIAYIKLFKTSLRHKHPPTTIFISSFHILLLNQLIKQFLNCSNADTCNLSHFCQSQGWQGLHGIQDLRVVWSTE